MNLAPRPEDDRNPDEPFVPDFSEGAETGLYLALLELLDEGLIITGDEVILEVNSAACRLLGRDYRQLAGQPLADIFPSERAFLNARARLFIQGEMRGCLQVATPTGNRNLKFIAAARLRPGIHALILSPDLAAEGYAEPAADAAPGDTLWPRLAAALEQPVLVVDDQLQVAAANAAALRTLGVERGALVGRPIADCIPIEWPEDGATPLATLHPEGGAPLSARVLPGPKPDWRLLILPPVAAISGLPAAPATLPADAPPPASRLLLPVDVFDATSQAILVSDAQNRIIAVNKAFTTITGYTLDEVHGKNPAVLSAGQRDKSFVDALWTGLAQTGQWQGEIWNRRKNGEIYPEWLSITAVRDARGKVLHYIGMFSDLTAKRQAESRADYIATHDILTGLPNRRLFECRFTEAAERARASHRSVGLMRLDLDNFKAVNREYGDNTGDAFLQQIARRLRMATPRGATVARERSDTLLVLLPDVDLTSEIGRAAEALLASLAQPFEAEGRQVKLGASIGIAIFPEHGTQFDALVRNANAALTHARQLGGNNHQYYADEMGGGTLEHSAFELNLRHSVEREQLEVHFQPLVDGRDGSLRGGEALLRWRHPDLGLIPFRRFLTAAREGGMLGELGDWVLHAACRHAAAWPARGGHPPLLTINVAIEQIMQGNLADRVQDALKASGLPPERLELDVDEIVLKEEHSRIQSALEKLAALGVRLAVDDFGRGVSSIPRLKRFPLRAIKLDPVLVRDVGVREEAEAVVEAIAAMAGALGLEVFARGVEGEAQQAFLCALDCYLQQGPLFGRPMTAEEFAAYVAGGKAP
ncbi:putative bifunctional diguanylate cyclase/phosphodiesterase [Pseudothauera rhizosphaerae]|nr:EAL domain-containing protein [Pseudothauera rhizosphaerae]